MSTSVLGIIGGSGLYDIEMSGIRWTAVKSPWGQPSDSLCRGTINSLPVLFMSRHGRGHRLAPSAINYRANIDVLKRAGATHIIAFSACGSLREDIGPGVFVIADQFIDRTYARPSSFFGAGCVAHVSMAEPFSPFLRRSIAAAASAEHIEYHDGGTYLIMEGPQFSSLAESRLYRSWGADLIGMTSMPEAKLAREAELPYAAIAMVTDFDCWHPGHGHVDAASVMRVMTANGEHARRLVQRIAQDFAADAGPCPIGSDRALDGTIVTPPQFRDPRLMKKLSAIARRALAAELHPVTRARP
jgi:5'-methylthioadenosine phosphorylase